MFQEVFVRDYRFEFRGRACMVGIMKMKYNDEMWGDCNAMVGRVLSYLDEDKVRPSIKKAVKSELWEFHNKHNGDDNDNEDNTADLGI